MAKKHEKFSTLLNYGITQIHAEKQINKTDIENKIADTTDYSVQTVRGWKRGERLPNSEKVGEIARYFTEAWNAPKEWIIEFLEAGEFDESVDDLLTELYGETEKQRITIKQVIKQNGISSTAQVETKPTLNDDTQADTPSQQTKAQQNQTTSQASEMKVTKNDNWLESFKNRPWLLFGIISVIALMVVVSLSDVIWIGLFKGSPNPNSEGLTSLIVNQTPETIDKLEDNLENDTISVPDCSLPEKCATFIDRYKNRNFKDVIPNIVPFVPLEEGWNDSIETITLPSKACVQLWEHDNFKGDDQTICNTSAQEETYILNDYIRDKGENEGKTWTREATSYQLWWMEK